MSNLRRLRQASITRSLALGKYRDAHGTAENRNSLFTNCNYKDNLVPRLLSALPVPSRCERTLVLSGHVIRARLPYEVGVGRLITFVSKCPEIVTVLFH